jgi:hypothetical protein
VQEQRMQISLASNIRFAFQTYSRAHMSDYDLNVGDNRWSEFKQSVKIRDRLMHPKQASDLEISLAEMDTLQNAYDWFTESIEAVMRTSVEAMTKDAKKNMTESEAQEFERTLGSL